MSPELAPLGSRRATWLAVLIVLAFAATMVAEPIVKFATHTFTSADLTQDYVLTALDDDRPYIENRGLCDPPLEMQPWLAFNRDELRAGRLPLWNPYNGNGVPHHANYQSAVFSPFSVPFYVFGLKTALIVTALMRLFCFGFFTYLFLRTIAFGFWSSTFAAVAFMLSGKSVMLLAYPHSAVATALPAALWCSERFAQALETEAPARRAFGWLAGLCLVFTLAIYAGHPEPLVFVTGLPLCWAAWRAVALGRRIGGKVALQLLGGFCAAGGVALLLGAPQILPFLEYLDHSVTAATRVPQTQPSLVDWWPLLVFPSAVGAPFGGMLIQSSLPAPNYEQVNTSYPGATVLWLALLGVVCVRQDRRARLFLLGIVVWLALTCDFGGLGRLWERTPVLGTTVLLSRSQAVWLFGLAVLAGVAVERVLLARPTRWSWVSAAAVACGGGALLALATWKADALLATHIVKVDAQFRESITEAIGRQRSAIIASAALAIGMICAALVTTHQGVKRGLVLTLLGTLVVQNAWVLHDFNPTVPDEKVYPVTRAIDALQEHVRDGGVLTLTDNSLPPDTNLMYRLPMVANYDALGVVRLEELQSLAMNSFGQWRTSRRASLEALALFGIEHVITAGDWVPSGTALQNFSLSRQSRLEPICVRDAVTVEQGFSCDRNGLQSLCVFAGTLRHGLGKAYDLRLRLYEAETDVLVTERTWSAAELRDGAVRTSDIAYAWSPFAPTRAFLAKYAVLEFEPQRASRGKLYRLLADCTSSNGEDSALVWYSPTEPPPRFRMRVNGVEQPWMLAFDYRTSPSPFKKVASLSRLSLHRFEAGLGPFFAVSTAVECADNVQVARVLMQSDFSPYRCVALERDPDQAATRLFPLPGASSALEGRVQRPLDVATAPMKLPAPDPALEPPSRAEIVSRSPTEIRLRVVRRDGGWLVACQTWFPGWKATVNGVERPVRIANYAFQGVELGTGLNDVVLSYEPESLRRGVWLALLGLVLAGIGGICVLRTSRSTRSTSNVAA